MSNGKAANTSGQSKHAKSVLITRKYFHIFAILVFLPGLIVDREMLMVASTCAIVVLIILEVRYRYKLFHSEKSNIFFFFF